jgi:dynein regulatory complex protein 1
MRTDYANQLNAIESEFERERAALLSKNDDEIKALFKQHKEVEEKFLRLKADQEEEQSRQLENLRSQDANNQAEQKIKLEKEMQILEKCMEDMKAVYRLNEEKLDFNTKVLTERATVNKKTSLLLRLRKRRFQDIVREVKRKYKEELAEFQRENVKSTEEFKNFTKMFKELQKKYERFEKSDNNRISEVWQMNEQEAKAIVEKIIQADKVVHSQQLNIEWKPPSDPIFA